MIGSECNPDSALQQGTYWPSELIAIMEFKLVDDVPFFMVLSVLVVLPPLVNSGTARDANVRYTHTGVTYLWLVQHAPAVAEHG